jgi:hypothetical protein
MTLPATIPMQTNTILVSAVATAIACLIICWAYMA